MRWRGGWSWKSCADTAALGVRIFSYDIDMPCARWLALVAAFVLTLPASALAQKVTRVTSGDTVEVDGIGKVQLLGIRSADQPAVSVGQGTTPPPQPRSGPDTPPTPAVSGALKLRPERPSRDYLRQLVLGKNVRVQYDPIVGDNAGHRAYLFLDDGTLVNAEMLRAGRARVDLSREFAHEVEFKQLEAEAKHRGLGIWINGPGQP
jgi:micrococcal nuclease